MNSTKPIRWFLILSGGYGIIFFLQRVNISVWKIAIAFGVIFVLALVIIFFIVIKSQPTSPEGELHQLMENYPEIREFIILAQQNGATHFHYSGPALFFYRIKQGRVENCFVEAVPNTKSFAWIIHPSNWKEIDQLPGNAISIPEINNK